MTPQHDKDTRFWDRAARKYAADPIVDLAGYETTLQVVAEQLQPHHKVLEIGCGTGMTAVRLAGTTQFYLATDISSEMIAIARERIAGQAIPSLSFEVSEPGNANEVEDHYDIVLAFNVLHLVPSLPSTLDSLHRQLRPGGLLISKTPCLRLMNPLIRGVIPLMQKLGKAPSVNVLAPGDIEAALRDAGFEIILQAWHGTKGKDARPYYVARKQ